MVKYFCDKCGKELTAEDVRYSLDMIGKELCGEHARIFTEEYGKTKYIKLIRPENMSESDFADTLKKLAKMAGRQFKADGNNGCWLYVSKG